MQLQAEVDVAGHKHNPFHSWEGQGACPVAGGTKSDLAPGSGNCCGKFLSWRVSWEVSRERKRPRSAFFHTLSQGQLRERVWLRTSAAHSGFTEGP